MPNTDYDAAIREAFAVAPANVAILHTLEVTHPELTAARTKLDLLFIVDDTGSMSGLIGNVKDSIADLVGALVPVFPNGIRYSLISFKDEGEGETVIQTGETFVDLETFETALDGLVASGGGDGPENGFGAVVMGCQDLDWRFAGDVGRAAVLFTDIVSHERGATREQAISALVAKGVIFSYLGPSGDGEPYYEYVGAGGDYIYIDPYGYYTAEQAEEYADPAGQWNFIILEGETYGYFEYVGEGGAYTVDYYEEVAPGSGDYDLAVEMGYAPLAAATGGLEVESETFLEDLIEAITLSSHSDGQSLYIVQDRVGNTFTLEDDTTHFFEPVGFRFTLPAAGENGLQELNLSIDNTDRRITDFINLVKGTNVAVVVKYRPYLSTDLTVPRMNPPLTLFLRDVSIDALEMSAKATFADILNRKFPSELYTRERFPSLGD
jgi:hypothetical protein